MNLLGKIVLNMLLCLGEIIMHYNFVQVLVSKLNRKCNIAPNGMNPILLFLS